MKKKLLWLKLRLIDELRYSRLLQCLMLLKNLAVMTLAWKGRRSRKAAIGAYKHAQSSGLQSLLSRKIWKSGASGKIDLPGVFTASYSELGRSPLNRTIVLKAPSGGEKGVLLVMCEYNWLKLLEAGGGVDYLNERFHLILSTCWSPTDYGAIAAIMEAFTDRVYVQACNYAEIPQLERFHPRIRCLPTIACDWLHPGLFNPKPYKERSIDLLMVANWAPFKRHWHLFGALARMSSSLRVTLIGQKERGHTIDHAKRLAHLLGVKQDIRFIESAPIEDVRAMQCDARASLILSRKEGCCVAVCESLFANSPMGMLRGVHVGPLAYLNDRTGTAMNRWRLDTELPRFLEDSGRYQPRQWAVDNISCFASIEKLNRMMRDDAIAAGEPWTVDLLTPCWSPYPVYLTPKDAESMRPAYENLHNRFPGVFVASLYDRQVAGSAAIERQVATEPVTV